MSKHKVIKYLMTDGGWVWIDKRGKHYSIVVHEPDSMPEATRCDSLQDAQESLETILFDDLCDRG